MACEGGPHGAHPGTPAIPGSLSGEPAPASRNGRSAARGSAGIVLDDLSKQIIEQLQQDGRRSYAAIGKAVGLTEAAVRQRVQRLIDAGVMQIVAVTDPMIARLPPADHDRDPLRRRPGAGRRPAGGYG